MIAPLALGNEAPAPALPADGDPEASPPLKSTPLRCPAEAGHGCFRRKLPSSRTCRGICYVKGFGCRPLKAVGQAPAAGVRKPPEDDALGAMYSAGWGVLQDYATR